MTYPDTLVNAVDKNSKRVFSLNNAMSDNFLEKVMLTNKNCILGLYLELLPIETLNE